MHQSTRRLRLSKSCRERRPTAAQRKRSTDSPPLPQGARLVLASASPRRQTLVGLLGLRWRAAPTDVDEEQHLQSEPLLGALGVALAKARAATIEPDELVIAADTLVVLDGNILGKPRHAEEARGMLRQLRGRGHDVVTGVVVRATDGREWAGAVATQVQMRAYSDVELTAYVERGEPFDKAGGYAIQDVEFAPVARIDGCYLNVVGLPLCAVAAGVEASGVSVSQPARRAAPCEWCATGAPLVAIRVA